MHRLILQDDRGNPLASHAILPPAVRLRVHYTAGEDTVYHFTMQAEADEKFKEGLKRFGSFFTSPLFTEGATGRELNAIESEHAKNLQWQ